MIASVQDLARALAAEVTQQVVAQLVDALARPGSVPDQRAAPPPPEHAAVFRREGEFWTVAFGGEVVRLRDCRGLHHLGCLLARPNQPVHVLELVTAPGPVLPHEVGLPVLDARAKGEYRRRLDDLEEELQEAEERGDDARVDLVLVEREFLVRELSRALGLGGRDRTTADAAERARVAVTKSLRRALRAIEEHHRPLGAHFARTVRTGLFCTYGADPAPAWTR